MARPWDSLLERWVRANLIDAATAERIRAFEGEHAQTQGFRWPVLLAWAFGGLLLGAGVLLFVAAHWERLSPTERFLLVLLMVGVFHIAGAFLTERQEALARVLHGVGTVALGAGIFMAGQIFHLEEHWPGGVMLWALGAWVGWALLRDWVQAALAAVLTPAWLVSEWIVVAEPYQPSFQLVAEGLLLLAITYLTVRFPGKESDIRRALVWIGGLALFPLTAAVVQSRWIYSDTRPGLPMRLVVLGWVGALLLPLVLAYWLRGRAAWMNLLAALWVVVLGTTAGRSGADVSGLLQFAWQELGTYFWCALGSVALVAWGLHESRRERINLGVAGFALTVLFFYFSSVMDKLGRSTSLIGLGLIFLVGGWSLEKARRRLVARVQESEK